MCCGNKPRFRRETLSARVDYSLAWNKAKVSLIEINLLHLHILFL